VKSTIETFTGAFFDYANPRVEDIRLEDIAQGLAFSCRFNGQIRRFYSIAEHSVLVRDIVRSWGRFDLAFPALHHDSAEAYLVDVPKPLKPFLGEQYGALTDAVDAVIGSALGVDHRLFHDPVLKDADRLALRIEANWLKPSRGRDQEYGLDGEVPDLPDGWRIRCLDPVAARWDFLQAHRLEASR
jgi:hypothetical protein